MAPLLAQEIAHFQNTQLENARVPRMAFRADDAYMGRRSQDLKNGP
jgi:hypothetical protein